MRSPDEEDTNAFVQHDPQEVVRTANLLVDEVIAKAREEAQIKYQKKLEEEESAIDEGGIAGLLRRGERWHSRARGIFGRILTHLRICK